MFLDPHTHTESYTAERTLRLDCSVSGFADPYLHSEKKAGNSLVRLLKFLLLTNYLDSS